MLSLQQSRAIRARPVATGSWLSDALVAFFLFASDAAILVCSLVIAAGVGEIAELGNLQPLLAVWVRQPVSSHMLLYIVSVVFVLVAFCAQGLYSKRRPFWEELALYLKWIFTGAVLEAGLLMLLSEASIPVDVALGTWVLAALAGSLWRAAARKLLSLSAWWDRPAIIVGTGENAIATYRALRRDRSLGVRVTGFIAENATDAEAIKALRVPVLTFGEGLGKLILHDRSVQVILALDALDGHEALFRKLSAVRPNLLVVPPLKGFPVQGIEVLPLLGGDVLLMGLRNNLSRWHARMLKRMLDAALAAVLLLVLFVPALLIVAFLIYRQDPGPIFFRHKRVGHGGRDFETLKFRTMVLNAESHLENWKKERPELWEAFAAGGFKLENDPRILPSGHWLRKFSIDELPQLLNVLKGDMSLVGPRPITRWEVDPYGSEFELYTQVRPGITGLWQVSGRSTTTWAERTQLEGWYVRNWSLWYDIAILIRTGWVVVARAGAY
jgi:undecaprenyl-phosphate galactose phosphotransferase